MVETSDCIEVVRKGLYLSRKFPTHKAKNLEHESRNVKKCLIKITLTGTKDTTYKVSIQFKSQIRYNKGG